MAIEASVIIPTFGRPEKLCECLGALAAQSLPSEMYEVIVTVDGQEPATLAAGEAAYARANGRASLSFIEAPAGGKHLGPCHARNRAIAAAAGNTLVFFNDDVVPDARCVERHLYHQQENDGRAIIVGDSPWRVHSPDSVFSRMLRETSMVFFHDRMRREPAALSMDWGFRHAWMLNLSINAESVRRVGGLFQVHQSYGRDDDELAFRLTRSLGLRVAWRPDALVEHNHSMTSREYIDREYRLGLGAPAFAMGAPRCSLAMFGRDLLGTSEIARVRAACESNADTALRLRDWFLSLEHVAAETVDESDITTAYNKHLPLKRWHWARGFVDGLSACGAYLATCPAVSPSLGESTVPAVNDAC